MRRLIMILAVAGLSMFDAATFARTSNGTIAGSVVDAAGAGVARAVVTAVGSHTNSNEVGED